MSHLVLVRYFGLDPTFTVHPSGILTQETGSLTVRWGPTRCGWNDGDDPTRDEKGTDVSGGSSENTSLRGRSGVEGVLAPLCHP